MYDKTITIFSFYVSVCCEYDILVDFDKVLPKVVPENSFEYVPGYVSRQSSQPLKSV